MKFRMRLGNWKSWIRAVPLVVVVIAVLVAAGLKSYKSFNSSKPSPSFSKAVDKAVDANAEPPHDSIHEKAALEMGLKKKPGHPPILLRLAELSRNAGQPKAAVEYLRQAVAADPKNLDARLELSRSLYEINDVDGAIAETKRLLADFPNQIDALYNIGAIYANLGKTDLARQYWTQAVATDPDSDSGRKSAAALTKIGR
ncbi:MAG: tetratricopeptide repeat protein [Bryobacteraceae bacterium]